MLSEPWFDEDQARFSVSLLRKVFRYSSYLRFHLNPKAWGVLLKKVHLAKIER